MALLPTLFKSNFNSIFYRAEVQNQSNPRSYELIKNKKKLSFKLNLFQRPNAIIKALFNRDKKHPFTIECCGPLLRPAVVDQLHTWSALQHSIVNRCCYFQLNYNISVNILLIINVTKYIDRVKKANLSINKVSIRQVKLLQKSICNNGRGFFTRITPFTTIGYKFFN